MRVRHTMAIATNQDSTLVQAVDAASSPIQEDDGAVTFSPSAPDAVLPSPDDEVTNKPFRFMELSAEMCGTIYELLLPNPESKSKRFNIAQTCWQIRHEAAGTYFAASMFFIREMAEHKWLNAQEELIIACMRGIISCHASGGDHGGIYH
ncbi:hypothetical protein DOTSEDRAFT_34707 [Dothistroma septosporum NZE10]|uniref:Uncharacterized protein n=1 Tax=Dothistroma septosporum (strain NZE10 / CBS 128990) TaxID=675120 RepID=N1PMR7_DOTSN|nr:hypothetical protein DOTSEDRAFT_34707 [Dothistroma septosporum NZE10]